MVALLGPGLVLGKHHLTCFRAIGPGLVNVLGVNGTDGGFLPSALLEGLGGYPGPPGT